MDCFSCPDTEMNDLLIEVFSETRRYCIFQLNIVKHQPCRIQHHAPVPKHIHRYQLLLKITEKEKAQPQF